MIVMQVGDQHRRGIGADLHVDGGHLAAQVRHAASQQAGRSAAGHRPSRPGRWSAPGRRSGPAAPPARWPAPGSSAIAAQTTTLTQLVSIRVASSTRADPLGNPSRQLPDRDRCRPPAHGGRRQLVLDLGGGARRGDADLLAGSLRRAGDGPARPDPPALDRSGRAAGPRRDDHQPVHRQRHRRAA